MNVNIFLHACVVVFFCIKSGVRLSRFIWQLKLHIAFAAVCIRFVSPFKEFSLSDAHIHNFNQYLPQCNRKLYDYATIIKDCCWGYSPCCRIKSPTMLFEDISKLFRSLLEIRDYPKIFLVTKLIQYLKQCKSPQQNSHHTQIVYLRAKTSQIARMSHHFHS